MLLSDSPKIKKLSFEIRIYDTNDFDRDAEYLSITNSTSVYPVSHATGLDSVLDQFIFRVPESSGISTSVFDIGKFIEFRTIVTSSDESLGLSGYERVFSGFIDRISLSSDETNRYHEIVCLDLRRKLIDGQIYQAFNGQIYDITDDNRYIENCFYFPLAGHTYKRKIDLYSGVDTTLAEKYKYKEYYWTIGEALIYALYLAGFSSEQGAKRPHIYHILPVKKNGFTFSTLDIANEDAFKQKCPSSSFLGSSYIEVISTLIKHAGSFVWRLDDSGGFSFYPSYSSTSNIFKKVDIVIPDRADEKKSKDSPVISYNLSIDDKSVYNRIVAVGGPKEYLKETPLTPDWDRAIETELQKAIAIDGSLGDEYNYEFSGSSVTRSSVDWATLMNSDEYYNVFRKFKINTGRNWRLRDQLIKMPNGETMPPLVKVNRYNLQTDTYTWQILFTDVSVDAKSMGVTFSNTDWVLSATYGKQRIVWIDNEGIPMVNTTRLCNKSVGQSYEHVTYQGKYCETSIAGDYSGKSGIPSTAKLALPNLCQKCVASHKCDMSTSLTNYDIHQARVLGYFSKPSPGEKGGRASNITVIDTAGPIVGDLDLNDNVDSGVVGDYIGYKPERKRTKIISDPDLIYKSGSISFTTYDIGSGENITITINPVSVIPEVKRYLYYMLLSESQPDLNGSINLQFNYVVTPYTPIKIIGSKNEIPEDYYLPTRVTYDFESMTTNVTFGVKRHVRRYYKEKQINRDRFFKYRFGERPQDALAREAIQNAVMANFQKNVSGNRNIAKNKKNMSGSSNNSNLDTPFRNYPMNQGIATPVVEADSSSGYVTKTEPGGAGNVDMPLGTIAYAPAHDSQGNETGVDTDGSGNYMIGPVALKFEANYFGPGKHAFVGSGSGGGTELTYHTHEYFIVGN